MIKVNKQVKLGPKGNDTTTCPFSSEENGHLTSDSSLQRQNQPFGDLKGPAPRHLRSSSSSPNPSSALHKLSRFVRLLRTARSHFSVLPSSIGGPFYLATQQRKFRFLFLFSKKVRLDGDAFFDELSLLRDSIVAVLFLLLLLVFPSAAAVDVWTPSSADDVIFDSEAVLFG